MTLKEILQQIGNRHGIDSLNPMQRAVTGARAERIILLAPTGSGKTLAFTIPLVERLKPSDGTVQAVVIAPSRELVVQIADVIRGVAKGYKVTALYGGHSMQDEVNSVAATPDIIVATPGRLLDHILRDTVDVSTVRALVLDEFDKSLELGFQDQMRRIIRRIRHPRYIMLTSATPLAEMPDFIDMSQAKVIDFSSKAPAPRKRTTVWLVKSDSRDKLEALLALLRSLPDGRTIVFVNHRESAERVYDFLKKQPASISQSSSTGFQPVSNNPVSANLPVGLYHGGLDQLQREIAVDMLNNGTTPILVSTDLGSRGLDIEDVRSVVHYHLPLTPESWTHRNGRTARVDATGDVYILVSEGEQLPDYIDTDRVFTPDPANNPDPIHSTTATVYFNGGKKEKVSKGDILGFLVKQCGIDASAVGKIIVKDHCAIVAVPADHAEAVIATAKAQKIKGQRLRATLYR